LHRLGADQFERRWRLALPSKRGSFARVRLLPLAVSADTDPVS
jgi:hypothetical protein